MKAARPKVAAAPTASQGNQVQASSSSDMPAQLTAAEQPNATLAQFTGTMEPVIRTGQEELGLIRVLEQHEQWQQLKEQDIDMDESEEVQRRAEEKGSQLAELATKDTKARHHCEICSKSCMASEILIDQEDPAYSWQGSLSLHCYECCQGQTPEAKKKHALWYFDRYRDQVCSTACRDDPGSWRWKDGSAMNIPHLEPMFAGEETQAHKRFRKAVQGKWRTRAIALQKTAPRIRSEAYRLKMADCMRERKLSTAQARKVVMDVASTFSVKVAAGMLKLSREQRTILKRAMEDAAVQAQREAEDPQLYRQKVMSLKIFRQEDAAEYVSKIVDGVDEFFICRKKNCRHIGPNHQWLKRLNHDRFRCPRCVMEQWPWVEKPDLVSANKAFVFSDMNPTVDEHIPELALTTVLSEEMTQKVREMRGRTRGVEMILTQWPSSEVSGLITVFKEIQLQIQFELLKLDPTATNLLFVQELEKMKPTECYFNEFPWTGGETIAWINSQGNNHQDPWIVPASVDPGPPRGAVYPYEEGQVILDYKDAMRMWGLTMATVEMALPQWSAL